MGWKLVFAALFLFAIITPVVSAEVDVYYFYGEGCPHCAQMSEFFKSISEKEFTLHKFEVYNNPENAVKFQEYAAVVDLQPMGVPTLFIEDKMVVGFDSQRAGAIVELIDNCEGRECLDYATLVTGETSDGNYSNYSVVGWVFLGIVVIIAAIILITQLKGKK